MGPLVRHALRPARPAQTLALMLALSLAVHAMALGLLARWPAAQVTAAVIAPAELVVVLVGDEVDVRAAAPVAPEVPASTGPAASPAAARPLRATAPAPHALVATTATASPDAVLPGGPAMPDAALPQRDTPPAAGPAAVAGSASSPPEPAPAVPQEAPARASSPLAYRDAPPPEYPESARRDGAQGLVVLDVTVSREGAPLEVAIAQSSGVPTLDAAAMSGVRRWRFAPALRDGDAVEARIRIPVRFRLTNDGR